MGDWGFQKGEYKMNNAIAKTVGVTLEKVANLTPLEHVLAFGLYLLGLLIGEWTGSMTLLIILQVIDVATGLGKGKKSDSVSSGKLKEGAKSKFGGWLYIIVGNVIDGMLTFGMPIAKMFVVSYLTVMELISIVENAQELGAHKAPPLIMNYLIKLKDKLDKTELPEENPK